MPFKNRLIVEEAPTCGQVVCFAADGVIIKGLQPDSCEEVMRVIYLIDPKDPTLGVCTTKCATFCKIKPLYGIII